PEFDVEHGFLDLLRKVREEGKRGRSPIEVVLRRDKALKRAFLDGLVKGVLNVGVEDFKEGGKLDGLCRYAAEDATRHFHCLPIGVGLGLDVDVHIAALLISRMAEARAARPAFTSEGVQANTCLRLPAGNW